MPRRPAPDPPSVVETRTVHDVHRRATTLLAGALEAPVPPPPDDLAALRDMVVSVLRHHHTSEDTDLWPQLVASDPALTQPLNLLTEEHHRLDEGLDRLAVARFDDEPGARDPAVAVRDLVHEHLDHEEPILFPALRRTMSDTAWDAFSARVVASAPPTGTELLVALLHEVATPEEVALTFRHLPPPAQAALPDVRAAGAQVLASVRRDAAVRGATGM